MAQLPSLFDPPQEVRQLPPASETNGRERLFLADAMALAYRAHFAFINRPLINSKGQDTSAVYGFTASLLKLLEDERPDHLAVVFDPLEGPPNFRDALYAEYKAHRPPMPDGIKHGIPVIKRIVQAFDIPCVEVAGVEADDVIGTLATRAADEDVDVVIVSPDKDFRQLLARHVAIMRPAYKGEAFDVETEATFRERYGVDPIRFIDILALLGDASDNVPGVPGIGEKTAPGLIQEHGSVEALLEKAEEITGKRVREGLLNNRDGALLSKKLVTILTDVDLGDLEWQSLRLTDPDVHAIEDIFNEMEFGGRLRTRVRAYAAGEARPARPSGREGPDAAQEDMAPSAPLVQMDLSTCDYRTMRRGDELGDIDRDIANVERFGFDTETTSTDAMVASLVGFSYAPEDKKAVYVPSPMPDGTPESAVVDAVRKALENPASEKVGHNLKYDLLVMARHGVEVAGPLFDTMVAHYLIEPEAGHSLDEVATAYLGYQPQSISELIGKGKDAISMRDVAIDKVGPYACEDSDIALRLMAPLRERLEKDGLLPIAEEIEFPLVRVLTDMERAGVKIDSEILGEISETLGAEVERLEKAIFEAVGREFTIGSPKQLGEILFSDESLGGLGLKPGGKTLKGAVSTNERVLSGLATEHPVPGLVLDWRQLTKLKSTYVDKLPELVHPETGRVHTDFNQAVAATGRLSSTNPNLQNIPVRSEAGREIRRAFVAEAGHRLVVADYAQIELRIIAHMSGDEELRAAFREGLDIHTATAARVFGVNLADVTRDMRGSVKQVNYGIPYGVSAFGLAQRLRVPTKEAQQLIEQYRASYPQVMRFLADTVEQARERGYVETLLGRRRYVPQIRTGNPRERSYAERIAVNMPIQGSQADMIKRAMVRIHRRLREEDFKTRMILQVHDELIFEAPDGEVGRVSEMVRHEMVGALPLDVPVEVDIGIADNWLDAH
ncbi:DNA polymerase I [soil metagenome]